ncbi:hypothetical protein M1D88_18315 [Arthrobacter sp. R1-13]
MGEGSGPNTAQLIAGRLGAVIRPLPAAFVYKSGTARDAALHSELVQDSLHLGPQCDVEDTPAMLGIGFAELRQIPQRIAVAVGRHKIAPIAAASSGGMISELVTDHATAADLVTWPQA